MPLVGLAAIAWARAAHYGHDATLVLCLITAMNVFTLLLEPMQAAFQAMERMKYLAYTDIINKTGQSLIGIALVLLGFRAIGIAGDMALVTGALVLLNIVWLRRFFRIDFKTTVPMLKRMVKQSSPYWATALFGYFYFWIDTIMLTLMSTHKVVGWYGATTQLFQTILFLPALISTAWLPRLVAAHEQGHRQLLTAARKPLEFILVISVPVGFGTALVSHVLVHAVYGAAFAKAVPVMIALATCIPFIYLNIVLVQVLIAAKRQGIWTVVMAGGAVVNPLFNLVLIPWTAHRYGDGAIGAAVSLVLTELLMTVAGFILVGRHVFDRTSVRRCLSAILASVGMWGAAYAARPLGTPVSLAVGGATLLALVVALRIPTSQEKALIRAGLARVLAIITGLIFRSGRADV